MLKNCLLVCLLEHTHIHTDTHTHTNTQTQVAALVFLLILSMNIKLFGVLYKFIIPIHIKYQMQ